MGVYGMELGETGDTDNVHRAIRTKSREMYGQSLEGEADKI